MNNTDTVAEAIRAINEALQTLDDAGATEAEYEALIAISDELELYPL